MLQIQDTLVSLDLIERFFCCDLGSCKGQCCLEGDAGAPVTEEEDERIKAILPEIWDDLLPAARREIEDGGTSYRDVEGELVTQLVENRNCVFATLADDGTWICALEKACREGRTDFLKPVSCHLYPVRLKKYPTFTAVNYDRWKICAAAEVLGRAKGIRAYKFLEGPLRRRFGDEWYDELDTTATEYIKQYCS
ncbi:MAG: DUF3109 family protein [Muribaculaceae bacterium]|nr:DUF3109 family protein [Muribaculaceae bacterium]